MFTTKHDIDRHVRSAFAKLRTDNEKNLRGYTVAKMYYKIGEYPSAQHYVSAYISVKKDNAAAYRLLGKCCMLQKKVENALEAYQKSLQVDTNQPDLVVEVSKLLLSDESNLTSSKLKFWKDLVLRDESIQDEAVMNLRFKLMSKSSSSNVVEDVIIKEIIKKPHDVNLRISLIKQFLDKKKVSEAFRYVSDIEVKYHGQFVHSLEWYNTVTMVLSTYKVAESTSAVTNKDFCCLYLNALERQIYLNLEADSALASVRGGNLSECVRVLFEFDQFLYQFSQANIDLRAEVAIQLVNYFRGQLCLHAATLLFKRDFTGNVEWQDAVKSSLVLLLHAYQCGNLEIPHNSMRQVPEVMKHLLEQWQMRSAFRCLQAGRTLLSAYQDPRTRQKQTDKSPQLPYADREELLMQIRGKCSNSSWKQGLFKLLFKGSDQIGAIGTSYMTTCTSLTEPIYELPTINQIETYENTSGLLNPASLQHQVYVRLKSRALSECDFVGFDCLNFSMSNLMNCAPSTLNQLDIETFLYATVMQTRRELELSSQRNPSGIPGFLPYANILWKMCSVDQSNWWSAAYKITTNGAAEEVDKIRSTVQDGLEVLRCVGNPRMDAMVALKIGQTLQDRLEGQMKKSAERNYLENRVELFYRYAVRQLKRYPNGTVMSTRKLFKYTPSPDVAPSDDAEMEVLATNAVTFLGRLYIDRERYEECVEELNESKIDGAAFFVSEANKKLAMAKTPQRDATPVTTSDTGRIDSKYIKRLVQEEVRKMQLSYSNRGHDESEYDFLSDEDALHGSESSFHRNRRSVLTDNTQQLQLIQQMTTLLSNLQLDFSEVKKELSEVKKELSEVKKELSDVKGHLATLQDTVETKVLQKESAASVLEDIYRLDDEETRRQQEMSSAVPTDYFGQIYNTPYPMYGYCPSVSGTAAQLLQQQLQRSAAMSLHQIPTTVPGTVPLYPDSASLTAAASLALNPQSPQILQRQAQLYDTMRLQQMASESTPLLYPTASLAGGVGKLPTTASSITGTTAEQYQYNMNNSVVKTWNSTFNNAPVEKLPPVNVVITSSDPLPTHTTISAAPPLLSVTIPPQHIKQSSVVPELSAITPPNTETLQQKPQEDVHLDSSASDEAELKALKAADEEGEIVRFSGAAKLFHAAEKELIECGLGDLKIFQNKKDQKKYRIFMRRDQGNKICANHAIVPEMEMSVIKHKDKSYSWTATDLVQGNLRLVKFYVRFKTTESSTEFKAVFEKIKAEMKMKEVAQPAADSTKNTPGKAVSFSFTGFPTNPQVSTTATMGLGKKPEDGDKKVLPNPFSGFTFGKPKEGGETEKNFSNLFTGFNTSGNEKIASVLNDSHGDTSLNRSAGDGEEDEYVSTAQFQPVIPLPKLIDVKTGEENETVLFEHRAKLLRFDKVTKEWKERGIGNMKVLVDKVDTSKVRLLMRREQVLKLCCNQFITKDLKFSKMQGLDTALTWYGQDFSENEVKVEMLAIRFKTADICSDFHNAVLKAQANMMSSDDQQNKPEESVPPVKTGFGDAFKKKAGQWECQGCCVVNAANMTECVACKGPKDPTAVKKEPSKGPLDFPPSGKFTFGMPPVNPAPKPAAEVTEGFGDKFKPKAGSWECKACFIVNQSDVLYCMACDSPKDDTVPKKNQSLNLTTQTKFTFGMPTTIAATTTASDAPATFNFGFKPPAATATDIFSNVPSFGFNSQNATNQDIGQKTAEKTDLSLQGKETFNFKFTPKSPGKVRSPTKTTPGKNGGSDDEGEIEEENNTYFTPVIPLPEKVEVKTGEENEDVVYCHRAKLYRFAEKEWKERGTGDVKILRDRTTKILRVLMRREPILKICLNHRLTDDVTYEKKDDKSWHFVVEDFSEGKVEVTQFCLRFKTADIAKEYLDAVHEALSEKSSGTLPNGGDAKNAEVKVNGRLSGESEEDEKLRVKLLLPERFFDYKTKADCSGCRGCNSDDYVFAAVENINGDLVDEKPIPLEMPDIPTGLMKSKSFFEKSRDSLGQNQFESKSAEKVPVTTTQSFFFGGAKSFSFATTGSSIFAPTFADTKTTTSSPSTVVTATTTASPFAAPTIETQKNIFGVSGENIFGGTTFSFGSDRGSSIFGGNTATATETPFSFQTSTVTSSTESGSIFGGTGLKSTFSFSAAPKALEKPFEAKIETGMNIFGGATLFGQKAEEKTDKKSDLQATGFSFTQFPTTIQSPDKNEPEIGKDILKMDENLSFATLAKEGGNAFKTAESNAGGKMGFFGLSHTEDFSHFGKATAKEGEENGTGHDEATYDPHYEPVIALPDEIKVSTGEEEESILFGQRSHLYRYDATNKEWKERGVGEFKVLHHPVKGTYRFVLRREQIHKLVLNHAITADFKIAPLNKTGKSFCWATMNYAEESPQPENLAVRFKNTDIATAFENLVKECIQKLKKKADLEPEKD